MCGRFAQRLPSSRLVDMYRTLPLLANVGPNHNVAPTPTAMVVSAEPEKAERRLSLMKWGLVPSWSKSGKMDFATINAKCETAATSATYRSAFRTRRCIVPADAFYEWKKLGDGPKSPKQPYAIARADGEPLWLAGMWEGWKQPDDEWLRTCTIITTTPNGTMANIHSRMPVVLAPEDWPVWLGEREGDHAALLKPCPAEWLRVWKVSARVGSVKNNDEQLLEPVE